MKFPMARYFLMMLLPLTLQSKALLGSRNIGIGLQKYDQSSANFGSTTKT